jgi:ribosomal-protein-alanine N-acetyltransferase
MSRAAAIVLLPARRSDELELARLSRDLIEHGLPWRWRPSRIAVAMRDPETVVLVARAAHEIVGFGIMNYGADAAHLALLAVAPLWRRRGIGGRILRWLEETADVAGMETIDLEVRADNADARRFYAQFGYEEREYVDGYYEGQASAWRLRRRLRSRHPS